MQTVSSWQNYNNVQIDYTLSNTYTLRMNNMDREAKMLILQQAITKRDSQDGGACYYNDKTAIVNT